MDGLLPLYSEQKNLTLDLIEDDLSFKAFYCFIDERAKTHPNRTAIKFDDDIWSYKQVAEHANRLAKLLIENGIKNGDIIGLALDRSPETIIALLAILKAGAAYLPLDPSYPKDRIEFMLSDADAKLLLTSKEYAAYFVTHTPELLVEDAWARLEYYDAGEPQITVDSGDLAYLLYTSGSTGKPKGVLVTHQNLANFLSSMQKVPGITQEDRMLALTTISFDIAGLELYLPLISGAQIILTNAETARDGWLLLELIKKEEISIVQATPYTWRMLIAAGWDDFLPLKAITGGEPLPRDLADKMLLRCSELWNQYGPTETTIYSTQKLVTSAEDITIGKPIDNTQVYVLDESLNKLPDGAAGELFIGGDGVADGYLNRAELTSERFIDDPFSDIPNAKMYRTGDLGRFTPNGEIQCLGRLDHQVKIRGFRIEPEEIEYALLKAEFVKEAVVNVNATGQGDPQLAAYIVPAGNDDMQLVKRRLKQLLSGVLPSYMIPDDFVFVPSIPITPNGKIDRKALDKAGAAIGDLKRNHVAPKTETEKQLLKIWRAKMGIENIGVTDDFFALGGHSLVAVQIMALTAKIAGKRMPISTLLKYPTIAKLALYLDSGDRSDGWKSLVSIRSDGSKTPLYIIHGEGLNVLYFNDLAANMDREQPVYGLQARGLNGDEPLEVMEEIAAHYAEEIIAQNPAGPYILAGYSFGGYVAVEMRRQMAAMGKDVKLIIFDTDAEKSEYKSWMYLFPRKVKRHLPGVMLRTKWAFAHPGKALRQTLKKRRAKPLLKEDTEGFYRQIKRIKAKLQVALRNYAIEPFDDKIYLYKAKICTHYVDDTQFLGWQKYAKRGVDICEVGGDHLSMLLHPNVKDFADKLQQGINSLTGLADAIKN